MSSKYLVVRFSSFGDIMQCLPAIDLIRENTTSGNANTNDTAIHFLTRSDFAQVVSAYRSADGQAVDQVWMLDRKLGFTGLLQMLLQLRREKFTHIYDAHSNLRSFIISCGLRFRLSPPEFIRRSKERFKRLLLFRFRINHFEQPYRGADSYLAPLHNWWPKVATQTSMIAKTTAPHFEVDEVPLSWPYPMVLADAVVLVPGAAWHLKEWPAEKWRELIELNPKSSFVILGGREDKICSEIAGPQPKPNVLNLAGKLTWLQSLKIISLAKTILAGDTGLMHAADLMGHNTLAFIGPTAFGYPARASSKVLEVQMSCKPCTKDGRGRCHNSEFKACLNHITADRVSQELHAL